MGTPLCMDQYYKSMCSCRIPAQPIDKIFYRCIDQPDAYRHVIIMRNNQVISMREFVAQLRYCFEFDVFQMFELHGFKVSLKRYFNGKQFETCIEEKYSKLLAEEPILISCPLLKIRLINVKYFDWLNLPLIQKVNHSR